MGCFPTAEDYKLRRIDSLCRSQAPDRKRQGKGVCSSIFVSLWSFNSSLGLSNVYQMWRLKVTLPLYFHPMILCLAKKEERKGREGEGRGGGREKTSGARNPKPVSFTRSPAEQEGGVGLVYLVSESLSKAAMEGFEYILPWCKQDSNSEDLLFHFPAWLPAAVKCQMDQHDAGLSHWWRDPSKELWKFCGS